MASEVFLKRPSNAMDTPANHLITNKTFRKILWIVAISLAAGGLATAIVGYNRSPKRPPAISLLMQIRHSIF